MNAGKSSLGGVWEVARHKSYVTIYIEKKFRLYSVVSMQKMRHIKDQCFHQKFNQSS